MRRRAMGQEAECGHVFLINDCPSSATGVVQRRFLTNGGLVYIDFQDHIEYASPECDGAEEVMTYALAGDRIIAEEVRQYFANALAGCRMKKADVRVFRNNICGYGLIEEPYGTHENYQVEAEDLAEFAAPLMAYLVTRQLVLGAGRLQLWPDGTWTHELAQRSGFLEVEMSHATTSHRPIINLRDEPHATGSKRLHVICGDNNILPQNTVLKFAMMDVLLTLREEGLLEGVELADPVAAVHKVSRRPGARLRLANGKRITALQIQRFYHDQAIKFVEQNPDQSHRLPALREYGEHLDRLGQSLKPEDHHGRLCWATKHTILKGLAARGYTPEQLRAAELSMHEIVRPDSLHQIILRRYGRYDEAAVRRAMTEPPLTTRAFVRGSLVASGKTTQVQWTSVNLASGERINLPDPLDPTMPASEVERLSA